MSRDGVPSTRALTDALAEADSAYHRRMEFPATNLGPTDDYGRYAQMVRAELEKRFWTLDQWINAGGAQAITTLERLERARLAWHLTQAWDDARAPGPPDPVGFARNHVCGLLAEAVADLLSLPADPDDMPVKSWAIAPPPPGRRPPGRLAQAISFMEAWLEAEKTHRGLDEVDRYFTRHWTRSTEDPAGG